MRPRVDGEAILDNEAMPQPEEAWRAMGELGVGTDKQKACRVEEVQRQHHPNNKQPIHPYRQRGLQCNLVVPPPIHHRNPVQHKNVTMFDHPQMSREDTRLVRQSLGPKSSAEKRQLREKKRNGHRIHLAAPNRHDEPRFFFFWAVFFLFFFFFLFFSLQTVLLAAKNYRTRLGLRADKTFSLFPPSILLPVYIYLCTVHLQILTYGELHTIHSLEAIRRSSYPFLVFIFYFY